MRILTLSFLVATLALSACNSRINPLNWGQSSEVVTIEGNEATVVEEVNPLIPTTERGNLFDSFKTLTGGDDSYQGIPVDQISSVSVESIPGGALIIATGVTDVQGVFDVRLMPVNDDIEPVDGVLSLSLQGVYLTEAVRGGPEQLRIVRAGVRLTDNQLADARTIRVEGRRNSATSRRR